MSRPHKHQNACRREVLIGLSTLTASMSFRPAEASGDPVGDAPVRAITDELVAANRILDNQGVLDAFGHVSCRHPTRPDRFLLSRSRAAGLVTADDIMEFDAAGAPVDARGRSPYVERFIHAAVYAARPDVHSVVHDHSPEVIPFTVVNRPLSPIANNAGVFGATVPFWDIRHRFGDNTSNLVTSLAIGQDLARALGQGAAVLMRGHGATIAGPSIRLTVALAIELALSAKMEAEALQLGGPLDVLTPGEIRQTGRLLDPNAPGAGMDRAWEYWCKKAGVPFVEHRF